jgi:cation transport regulator ChaC
MTNDSWYFAYGSNLLKDQKQERTGDIRTGDERPRIAVLDDYRLAFNKRGGNGNVYANVIPCSGEKVMGVVYRWDHHSRTIMATEYEKGYEEKMVEVVIDGKVKLTAVTFIASSEFVCKESPPSDDYLCKIITGAKQHGLPSDYIRRVQRIAKCKRSRKPGRDPRQLELNFVVERKP